jgi:methylphosphotriester-DNA--protein-cysteine methyltransferase
MLALPYMTRDIPACEYRTRPLGLLPKTFVRRFRRHAGLTPKLFSRVRRLQRVLRSMNPTNSVDWAALAA